MTRFLNDHNGLIISGFLTLLLSACTPADGLDSKGEVGQMMKTSPASLEQKPITSTHGNGVQGAGNQDEAMRGKIAANFAAAILDGKRKFETSSDIAPNLDAMNLGGMKCNPGTLPNMVTNFTLSLPIDLKARTNNLVVLTPERGVYALYYPYDLNEPAEDYIIPSEQIDWQNASKQSDFTVQPQLFDGMKLDTQNRFQIFLENGTYQFALLKNTWPEHADVIRSPQNVVASCSVQYRGS